MARDHLGDFGTEDKILKWVIKKYGVRVWAGLISLKTGTNSRLL